MEGDHLVKITWAIHCKQKSPGSNRIFLTFRICCIKRGVLFKEVFGSVGNRSNYHTSCFVKNNQWFGWTVALNKIRCDWKRPMPKLHRHILFNDPLSNQDTGAAATSWGWSRHFHLRRRDEAVIPSSPRNSCCERLHTFPVLIAQTCFYQWPQAVIHS